MTIDKTGSEKLELGERYLKEAESFEWFKVCVNTLKMKFPDLINLREGEKQWKGELANQFSKETVSEFEKIQGFYQKYFGIQANCKEAIKDRFQQCETDIAKLVKETKTGVDSSFSDAIDKCIKAYPTTKIDIFVTYDPQLARYRIKGHELLKIVKRERLPKVVSRLKVLLGLEETVTEKAQSFNQNQLQVLVQRTQANVKKTWVELGTAAGEDAIEPLEDLLIEHGMMSTPFLIKVMPVVQEATLSILNISPLEMMKIAFSPGARKKFEEKLQLSEDDMNKKMLEFLKGKLTEAEIGRFEKLKPIFERFMQQTGGL